MQRYACEGPCLQGSQREWESKWKCTKGRHDSSDGCHKTSHFFSPSSLTLRVVFDCISQRLQGRRTWKERCVRHRVSDQEDVCLYVIRHGGDGHIELCWTETGQAQETLEMLQKCSLTSGCVGFVGAVRCTDCCQRFCVADLYACASLIHSILFFHCCQEQPRSSPKNQLLNITVQKIDEMMRFTRPTHHFLLFFWASVWSYTNRNCLFLFWLWAPVSICDEHFLKPE